MPCSLQFEGNAFCQIELLAVFESPGEIVDGLFDTRDIAFGNVGEFHGVGEHGDEQCLGRVGTDNFTLEALLDQFRYAPDVIDVWAWVRNR